jgi:PAS domain S-box-containing protein
VLRLLSIFFINSPWRRYTVALGSVATATLVRMALDPALGPDLAFSPFIAAVAATAIFGGRGPAVLSAVLGFAVAEGLFVHHGLWAATARDIGLAASYALLTLVIVWFSEAAFRARDRALQQHDELLAEIRERVRAETALRQAHDFLDAEVRRQTAELNSALESQRQARERLQQLLELLPVNVSLITTDLKVKFGNLSFRSRFGTPNGKKCFEQIYGRDEACCPCTCFDALREGSPLRKEVNTSGGQVHEVITCPWEDPDGGELVMSVGVDITERKNAELKLREQAALLDLAHDAILVFDVEGRISFWNHGAERIYGWAASEAVGKNVHTLLKTESSQPLQQIFEIVRGQNHWEGELTHFTRAGVPIPVASRWSAQRDETGLAVKILEINRDISLRKKVTADLRRSQERLALAMRSAGAGDFQLDVATNVLLWSGETERIFGIEPDACRTYADFEPLVVPEDLAPLKAAVEESLRTGELRAEFRIRRPNDGQVRWISSTGTVSYAPSGEPLRVIGIDIDVTEQKKDREYIRLSEERYRALVEATSLIVWSRTPDDEIKDVSSWKLFTGQTDAEIKGGGWADALHPEDRDAVSARRADAIPKGKPYEVECRLRRYDGVYRDIDVRNVPVLNPDGSVREWISACVDITERNQAQRELQAASEELKQSNVELQQFAYVASHDLQEPLRMVSSFTQLLASRYADKLDDNAREFIGYAVEGAARMQKLIQDLLALSRVGTRGNQFARVPLAETMEKALANLQLRIQETQATVEYDTLPDVVADGSQLTQLLQNLIGNAIKFRSQEPPRVRISAARAGQEWQIAIRDNGIGFEQQFADRIFVVFQRLHTRAEYPGTGIGLAICKKIVERHRGRIWAESTPGFGSTFFFTLPDLNARAENQGNQQS